MNKNDYINKNGCIIDSLMCMFCKSDRVKWKKIVFIGVYKKSANPPGQVGFQGLVGWVGLQNFF